MAVSKAGSVSVKKVDVVRSKPRTTETVGDDGTLDSDFLSKPRRPTTSLIKPYSVSFSHISDEDWESIFGQSREDSRGS